MKTNNKNKLSSQEKLSKTGLSGGSCPLSYKEEFIVMNIRDNCDIS